MEGNSHWSNKGAGWETIRDCLADPASESSSMYIDAG